MNEFWPQIASTDADGHDIRQRLACDTLANKQLEAFLHPLPAT